MRRAANGDTGAAWLTVREAAAIAGASVRAMQKRAARGSIAARKVERDGVNVWEFDARDLGAPTVSKVDASTGANGANLSGKVDAPNAPAHVQSGDKVDASNGANMDAPGAQSGRTNGRTGDEDLNARLLAQLESENSFLRATVEQLQRDGAETRAALRAALKLTESATVPQLTAAPEVAGNRSATRSTFTPSPDATAPTATATQSPAGAAVTYGDIADEIERRLSARKPAPTNETGTPDVLASNAP